MDMEPVKSSNVAEVGYDANQEILGVRFSSGKLYHYKGVASHVYEAMMASESIGSYFAKNVRSRYEFELIRSES